MQNISYFWRRIGAFVIDFSISFMFYRIVASVLFILLGNLFSISFENLTHDYIVSYLNLGILILVPFCYNVGCYHFFKFPLGKLLMNIKIYNHDQKRVVTGVYARRELLKFTYFYATLGLYAPYQFIRYVIKKKQTFHERQSNTYIFM